MSLSWAPVVLLLSVTAGAVTPTPTVAGSAVDIRIGAVLASNNGQEFDPRLVALHRQLSVLFPYTSYRLVKQEKQRVRPGGKVGFDIPGGRYLLVIPKGMKNQRVSLRVMLIEGTRPVVDTALTLRNHATFLVGGPRHNHGVLIISIGADTVPGTAAAVPTSAK